MRKVAFIAVVAILVLAVIGFGLAKWSDCVKITKIVETGKVCVGILDGGVLDPGPDPQQPPGCNSEGKDVACTESQNVDPKCKHCCTQYYAEIVETIKNAYPYYKTGTKISIANCGTIPVKIEKIDCAWNDPGGIVPHMHVCQWVLYLCGTEIKRGTTWEELCAALNKFQLDPCQVLTADIWVYFDQGTPQGQTAVGTWAVTASQWNEVF
ncbi:hypothetical protein [Thermodesulfitimonas autotrophica]|uniref:hypothetical protein n=1 Tax=Thermodesulfitimonas autotrophica TaxID=1894989 RepID=UPI002FE2C467